MHRIGMQKVFDFESLLAYEKACNEGWHYNPADLKKENTITAYFSGNKDLKESESENTSEEKPLVEPRIHRPEVPGQINPEPINPLKCKLCDFVGKSETSLRMHKLHGHKKDD